MWNPINRIIAYGVAFNSARMLVGAISAMFLLSQGMSLTDIGWIKTLQAIVIMALDIPVAYVADKYSRKLSVVLSVLCGALWLLVTGLATERFHFYVAEVFNALSLVFLGGAFVAFLIDEAKSNATYADRYHKVLAQYQKFQFLSMGIASFIGSLLVKVESNEIWLVAGGLCIVLLVFFSWFLPKDVHLSAHNAQTSSLKQDWALIREQLGQHRDLFSLTALSLLVTTAFYQILIQFWQPLAGQMAGAFAENGIFYGAVFAAILWVQSKASAWAGNLDTEEECIRWGMRLSWVSLGLAIGLSQLAPNWLFIAVVAIFASNRLLTIGWQGAFHRMIPSEFRSTLDSMFSTVLRGILLFLMPVTGYAFQRWGYQWLAYGLLLTIVTKYVVTLLHSKALKWNAMEVAKAEP